MKGNSKTFKFVKETGNLKYNLNEPGGGKET